MTARLRIARLGFYCLVLLAATLPFELDRPLLALGPLAMTNTELLLGLVLAAAVVAPRREGPGIPRLWLALAALFAAAIVLSALLAPQHGGNALRAALRTASGLLLVPAVLHLAPEGRQGRAVAYALVAGGLVAAAIGLIESASSTEMLWLQAFRIAPTHAGSFLRLTGPFDYANQAAMFIEATLPFVVTVVVIGLAERSWPRAIFGVAAMVFYTQAAIQTFSRASFATLALVFALVALLLGSARDRRGRLAATVWAGAALVVVVLLAANWLAVPTFRLRLQSDVDGEWYGARVTAPESLELAADKTQVVTIDITNTGSMPWRSIGSSRFNLGARWLEERSGRELVFQPRWPLNGPIEPGESVTVSAVLRAPIRGGEYSVIWDMVHENVTWFAARSDSEAITRVEVVGDAPPSSIDRGQVPTTTWPAMRFNSPLPPRSILWRIAVDVFMTRPITGIGLDNFRLTYGEHMTDELPAEVDWNNTVHANNLYLETLASLGIAGALPLFFWLALLAYAILRALRRTPDNAWLAAAGAGLLAFMIHGLLDYFMLFNATGLLFWTLVGLWLVFNHDHPGA